MKKKPEKYDPPFLHPNAGPDVPLFGKRLVGYDTKEVDAKLGGLLERNRHLNSVNNDQAKTISEYENKFAEMSRQQNELATKYTAAYEKIQEVMVLVRQDAERILVSAQSEAAQIIEQANKKGVHPADDLIKNFLSQYPPGQNKDHKKS